MRQAAVTLHAKSAELVDIITSTMKAMQCELSDDPSKVCSIESLMSAYQILLHAKPIVLASNILPVSFMYSDITPLCIPHGILALYKEGIMNRSCHA